MKKKIIDREATFALIQKENPKIALESLDKKADYFWQDACDNLGITALTKEVLIMEEK